MNNLNRILKGLIITGCALLMSACPTNRPAPNTTPGTTTLGGGTFTIPNQVLGTGILGCVDAAEIIGQSATLPPMPLTLDAQDIFDRVDTSASGATYTFAIRPVDPSNCASTTLPSTPPVTISFGFNYSGDFSRVNPLCMNASVLDLTAFSVTGTPIDLLIEPFFKNVLWMELDKRIADGMHPLINGGTRPATANPRCNNWVDQSTL